MSLKFNGASCLCINKFKIHVFLSGDDFGDDWMSEADKIDESDVRKELEKLQAENIYSLVEQVNLFSFI